MANYIAYDRSNYFKVKNVDAFRLFIENLGLTMHLGSLDGDDIKGGGTVTVIDEDGGGIPEDERWDEEKEQFVEFDFFAEVAKHLTDDSVAEFRHIGHEKLRYLVGCTVAVNSKGEILALSLDDIGKMVKKVWGLDMNPAQ